MATINLNANSIPTIGSGAVVPVNLNKLYASDDNNHILGITDIYVGPHQPLAGIKIWHDTVTDTIKHNNGLEWAKVESVAAFVGTRDLDCGGFLEEIKCNLTSGNYASNSIITLESTQGSQILYSIDGTDPSIIYTNPIPIFNGTLRASIPNGTIIVINFTTSKVYTGLGVSYSTVITDNPYIVIDKVTSGVYLSIFKNGGSLVNIKTEGYWNQDYSPEFTLWAFSDYMGHPSVISASDFNTLRFYNFSSAIGFNPPDSINRVAVCYIPSENMYFDVKFTNWPNNANGTVSYERSILPAVSTPLYYKTSINDIIFDNPDYANTVDTMTRFVALTRYPTGLLYNTVLEVNYANNVSPSGVKFAFSALGPNSLIPSVTCDLLETGVIIPVFSDFKTASEITSSIVGVAGIMYLETENIYIDITFTRWSTVTGTGGFAYTRASW